MSNSVVITSAVRTAVGSLGKSLKNIPGNDLGASVISKLIEKSNLKIGENILAIRLTDLDGPGGFNGKIILKNAKNKFEIPIDQFKFIHHAFFINGQFIVHGYNHEELLDISKFLKENIHRGVIYGGANEYSILYDRILRNIIPFTLKGALWYQGEANTRNFEDYQTLFSGMIADWREAWGYNLSLIHISEPTRPY